MLGNPTLPAAQPQAPAPQDPYTTSVMSYADKVRALLEQRSAPVAPTEANPSGPPVTGTLPGTPPENPNQDNMTINARSGEYVFPEPAVKYYGVKKLQDMVHKAIEDINPPGQPAPEPPTQAQTYAKGGLINRKHFLRLPKGHAYDKMSPKKHPLKQPVGLPPMAPDNLEIPQQIQQQMGPPAQPTQPPLPHYWGGGIVHNNPDYWSGRNWSDWSDSYGGPQVQMFGGRNIWNPNSPQYQPFPDFDQINRQMSGTEWQPHAGSQHTPRRLSRYMGGPVEPEGYWRGGQVQVNRGGFDPGDVRDNPFAMAREMYGGNAGRWYGSMLQHNPYLNNNWPSGNPGFQPSGGPGINQGQTLLPSYFNSQGYPYAQPVGPDVNLLGGSRHVPEKKNQ